MNNLEKSTTNKGKILITIAGPTAVGKTDLCLQLAKELNADIFSADSRQLYKELTIGTAKPSEEELSEINHHFINHISIHDPYNVGMYEEEIDQAFNTYYKTKDIAILSGGTGLYIKAALEGLDIFPEVDDVIKAKYENLYESSGLTPLQEAIRLKDPEYAKQVDLSNARRLIRALSVTDSSGSPFSSFLNKKEKKQHIFQPISICLTRPREELYERINLRVDQMIKRGLEKEARDVTLWNHLPSLQTVGYSELFKFFDGEIKRDEAIELIKRNSRRYAKRQMTWFRNQGNWLFLEADNPSNLNIIIDKIRLMSKN